MSQSKAQLVDTEATSITFTASGTNPAEISVQSKLNQIINVLDFGADPTGAVESRSSIQNAIDSASGEGANVILVPPGTYRCYSGNFISLPSNISIIGHGATLDFSGNPGDPPGRVRAEGTLLSEISLTADIAFNTSTLTLSTTSGLERGQVLLLKSNGTLPESGDTLGEFVTVRSIVSGTQITIVGTAQDDYLVADGAAVQVIDFKENITVQGLRVLGKGTPGTGSSSNEAGFFFLRAKNFKIDQCVVDKCDYQSIILDSTYEWEVSNCKTFQEEDNIPGEVIQYGITMKNCASNGVVRGNSCFGGRHGIVWTSNSLPGISRNVIIRDNFIQGTYAGAITTHQDTVDVSIISNYIEGCGRAMDLRVRRVRVINNVIKNQDPTSLRRDGIYLTVWPGEILIQGNVIRTGRHAIRMYDVGLQSAFAPYDVVVDGNTIYDQSQQGILFEQVDNNTAKPGFFITNNTFKGCVGDCVRFNGRFVDPVISNNLFTGSGAGFAVRLMGTEKAQVLGNTFVDFTNPIRLESSDQIPAAAVDNPIIANNVWKGGGALISGSGTNVSDVNNIQHV